MRVFPIVRDYELCVSREEPVCRTPAGGLGGGLPGQGLYKLFPKSITISKHFGDDVTQRVTGAETRREVVTCPSSLSQQQTQTEPRSPDTGWTRVQYKPQGGCVCPCACVCTCTGVDMGVCACVWCAYKERHLRTSSHLPFRLVQTSHTFWGSYHHQSDFQAFKPGTIGLLIFTILCVVRRICVFLVFF